MKHTIAQEFGPTIAKHLNEVPEDLERVARIIAAFTGIQAADIVFVEDGDATFTIDGQTNVTALFFEGVWTVGIEAGAGDVRVYA